jgi:hypothetical protein
MFRKQLTDLQHACAFAKAIVDTVREPLVVLDQDLRVIAGGIQWSRYAACQSPFVHSLAAS